MARITFNPNQPIQSLSGTVGNITFRTVNGRTHAFQRAEPLLPKHPTRKQRALFKQRSVINNCIAILQSQYEDIQMAIAMRTKLKDRLRYLYQKFVKDISAPSKLQKAIMSEYHARFSVTSTGQSRSKLGPSSVQSRTKTYE